ncbi:hypothetical protein [Pelagibacterium lentulum]|uniref:Uncharacterized protein n=1 Tax=Pelagibacterium lentulum TaxID=2029865 RepID=A0A916W1T8_9HYPH|nr:hypothetical protein [Pelagibacterium lentulum]GGA60347.1 hypothetical protein GCM10011499_33230 [Pelagibacterium lentulum]
MVERSTVAQTIRDEVSKHKHSVIRINATSQMIAAAHKCQNDMLIRRAIIERLKLNKQVAQL